LNVIQTINAKQEKYTKLILQAISLIYFLVKNFSY